MILPACVDLESGMKLDRRFGFLVALVACLFIPVLVQAQPADEVAYRAFPVIGSRVAIWGVAQLHLLFAAFVLAVPMFALIIEYIGYRTGEKRYDQLAYEFTKLLSVAFSLTAAQKLRTVA